MNTHHNNDYCITYGLTVMGQEDGRRQVEVMTLTITLDSDEDSEDEDLIDEQIIDSTGTVNRD